ncbi:hypothetical protein WA158_002002 [Blastocystis sp. Blastoise]
MANKLTNVFSMVGIDQGGVDINMKKGDVHVTGVEVSFFNKTFDIVDTDADDKIAGKEGSQFLRRSGLDDDTLADIWKLACNGKSKPTLSRNGWMIACKLVAVAQEDGEPSMKKLFKDHDYKLPNFALELDSDYTENIQLPTDGSAAIVASIEKPHTVGTFMNKHTEYSINVQTKMSNFPEGKIKVSRRYSDFEWLNLRLKHKFMDHVIPPIPEKQNRNRFAKDFVEGRLLGLQNFVNEVIADPTLVCTYEVQVFFTVSSEGMAAVRAVLPDGEDVLTETFNKALNATKMGVKTALEAATGTSIDIKDELEESEFREAEGSLVNYSDIIKNSVTAGDKLVANQKNTARELQCISAYYINFMKVARTYESEEALDFFTQTGEQVRIMSDMLRDDAEAQHGGIVTTFRYLQGKAGSVRAVMKNRTRAEKAVLKAEKAVSKKEEEAKEAKSEGKKAHKAALKEVEEAKESLSKKEQASEEVLKGVKDGFLAFHKERVLETSKNLIKHVESRIAYNEELIHKYEEMLKSLDYTEEEKKLSQERLERVAQEEQAYLDNLAALEAAGEGATDDDYEEDDEEEEESEEEESESEEESDDDSDDDYKKKSKKGKKAAKKPAKKAAKKPAKKSKKADSSDDDDDDDDDDDSDSDYADL